MEGPRLIKRGGVWYYRLPGGKPRTTGQTVRRDAQQILDRAWATAQARARGEEPDMTVRELGELWVSINRGVKAQTYVDGFERWLHKDLHGLGDIMVGDLTTDAVERARAAYVEAGHARSSADTWLARLKVLAGWSVARKAIRAIPFRVCKLGHQRPVRPILPVSRRGEYLLRVVQASKHEPAISHAVVLMLLMGLRETEAIHARWEWLDAVRLQYTPGRTKGREAWPRPFPHDLLVLLPDRAQHGPIVVRTNGRPVTPRQIKRAMDAANKAFGVLGLTPHSLRRSYATHLSDSGVPIEQIRRVMGHKSVVTTLGYIHSGLDAVREAQNSFPALENPDRRKTDAPEPAQPRETSTGKF
jgi:integrase/recombinase XerC